MSTADSIPPRVEAGTKTALMDLVTEATAEGFSLARVCEVLRLEPRRLRRWYHRADQDGIVVDRKPGAVMNAITPEEMAAILDGFEQFGQRDFSHRRLAHRGSYEGLFWVSPSTVERVLNDHDLRFRHPPRPTTGRRRPFPSWASYTPNSIWIYDSTHFTSAGMVTLIIEDLISRKWVGDITSFEETHTQVQAAFEAALRSEGLWEAALERAHQIGLQQPGPDGQDELNPILLALSDNGPQMTAGHTREFMALVAIGQHFGRPATPNDQAWIESLNGTIKREWPHLLQITDPAILRAELQDVRTEYNSHRLHSGIGYVTPDDEHEGRGEAIRAARKEGMERARQLRLEYHRQRRNNQ